MRLSPLQRQRPNTASATFQSRDFGFESEYAQENLLSPGQQRLRQLEREEQALMDPPIPVLVLV